MERSGVRIRRDGGRTRVRFRLTKGRDGWILIECMMDEWRGWNTGWIDLYKWLRRGREKGMYDARAEARRPRMSHVC